MATVDPEEMMCYSSVASIAGIIGITVFCVLLVGFCTLIGLNAFGILPDSVKKIKIFGNPLWKYNRVDMTPKPSRSRLCGNERGAEPAPDLEWDNAGDIGRI